MRRTAAWLALALAACQVVIEEGLYRLRAIGAEAVVVYTGHENAGARALYESLGFRVVGEDYDYSKPL